MLEMRGDSYSDSGNIPHTAQTISRWRRERFRCKIVSMAQYSQQQIQDMITAAASKYGIPASVALAVAQHESSFNPAAVSATNKNGTQDYGLFQLNTATLQQYGLSTSQALDPATNIDIGVQMLGGYYSQYGGDLPSVLGAFNAGPGAVASGKLPTSYISAVMNIIGPDSSVDLSPPDSSSSDTTPPATGVVNILGSDVPISSLAIGGAALLFSMWLAFKD